MLTDAVLMDWQLLETEFARLQADMEAARQEFKALQERFPDKQTALAHIGEVEKAIESFAGKIAGIAAPGIEGPNFDARCRNVGSGLSLMLAFLKMDVETERLRQQEQLAAQKRAEEIEAAQRGEYQRLRALWEKYEPKAETPAAEQLAAA